MLKMHRDHLQFKCAVKYSVSVNMRVILSKKKCEKTNLLFCLH
jgi:hypothetical protein